VNRKSTLGWIVLGVAGHRVEVTAIRGMQQRLARTALRRAFRRQGAGIRWQKQSFQTSQPMD